MIIKNKHHEIKFFNAQIILIIKQLKNHTLIVINKRYILFDKYNNQSKKIF